MISVVARRRLVWAGIYAAVLTSMCISVVGVVASIDANKRTTRSNNTIGALVDDIKTLRTQILSSGETPAVPAPTPSVVAVAGDQGSSGEQGPVGSTGTEGPVGPAGDPGVAGPSGQSVVGPPGPQGDPGPAGADGQNGRDGADGQPGTPGADGAAGRPPVSITFTVAGTTYTCLPNADVTYDCQPQGAP